ncbi:GDYXXLXY domain-containing protein [Oxalobacter sp. OttesenSCG-928-P03]|nr:GDYXXLXY domain-containing protein [Oxalobacter sp. OttesenSCG-928-P03]
MSEITPYQEAGISSHPALTAENDTSLPALGWGLFGRFFLANAGTLFLLAGIICFFAYNWENLTAFAKFGIIAAGMLMAAAFPLRRGLFSTSGSLGLLACGILGGALMAVYGQVYQTGANAWELFRSWAFFLIPLTILGRQAGLWFALWLVSTLWGILYLGQRVDTLHDSTMRDNLVLFQCLAQTAFFIAWEAAAHFFAGPRFPFLKARWLLRIIGLSLLAFLTFALGLFITGDEDTLRHPLIYTGLYLALMTGGAFYYRVRHTDLFMIASGLFSLIILVLTSITHQLRRMDMTVFLSVMVVILLVGSAVSGKLLIAWYRKWKESIRQYREKTETPSAFTESVSAESSTVSPALPSGFSIPALRLALEGKTRDDAAIESDETDTSASATAHTPWQARILMGLCAWIAVPCMIALIFTLFTSSFDTRGYSILFLLLLGTGIALSYLRGVFFGQAALCMCLTGASAAGVLLGIETGNRQFFLLPSILIFAVSAFPARNNAYRFLAATFAVTLLLFQVDLLAYPLERGHYRYLETVSANLGETSILGLAAFGLIYSACCAGLVHAWRKFTRSGTLFLPRRPFVASLFAIPLMIGIFSLLFHSSRTMQFLSMELGMSGISIRMIGIGGAAGLGYLIFQLTTDLDIRPAARIIMTLLCIPAGVASWYMPWFGIGLLMLAMSRQAGSITLLGTATLFLACCTVLEYYALSTTLLVKSLSLGGIGIILLIAATGLHQYMSLCVKKGLLPVPSWLAPASKQTVSVSMADTPAGHTGKLARALVAGSILVFFLFFAYGVQQKEHLLGSGERIVLDLRPVDPRSLMQGDYMTLRLEVEDLAYQALQQSASREETPGIFLKGTIVVAPDDSGVFRFVRLDDGTPLQEKEARLLYRGKRYGIKIGSGSFFFQEGYGKIFETARYVELRASPNGETLITHLLDEKRERIVPGSMTP